MTSESVEIPAVSVHAANGGPIKKSKPGAGRSELGMALLFIAPATIGFLVFYLYPTIRGFYFSLTKYNLLGTPQFIGFDNYVKIANDKLFWNALVVTLEYVLLNIVFQTAARARARRADAAAGQVDAHPRHDPAAVPDLQRDRRAWSGSGCWTTRSASSTSSSTGSGSTRIAVLRRRELGHPHHRRRQRVAAHGLHRAADLRRPADHPRRTSTRRPRSTAPPSGDRSGGSPCPLLRPVLALVLVVTVIGSFQVFDTVAVTTQGGPVNASRVMQYYIYQKGFAEGAVRLRLGPVGHPVRHPRRGGASCR